ncbi:MAG: extracellular solute-binding protein [Betaproteobacteria bacterium]
MLKRWLSLSMIVVMTTLLWAASAAVAAAKEVTIEYWQYYYESKVKLMTDLIKQFEEENPGIRVEQKTFPYEQFNQKVAISVPAGTGPDVVNLYYGWVPKYVEGGYLQPLPTDAFPPSTIQKEFLPMVDAAKLNGQYWGLPTAVRALALFWNKDLFKEAGLDPNAPPQTWEQLQDYAIKLTKRDKNGQLVQEGYAWNADGQDNHVFIQVLLRQWGVTPFSADNKQVLWNSKPGGYEAFQWWTDLAARYRVGDPTFMGDYRTAFITGKAAMMIDGSFALGTLRDKAKGINWGVTTLPVRAANPSVRANVGSFWMNALTVNAKGEKRDAAIKFLKFLTSPEVMKVWLEQVGELPARLALTEDPALQKDPVYGPFLAGLKYAYATFFVDETSERQAIIDATNEVRLQGANPKAALDRLVANEQKIRDEYFGNR